MRSRYFSVVLVIILCGFTLPAFCQPGGGGGGPNFAGMRQQMLDRMKEMMGASEDEWKVLGPKIEAIQTLQTQASNRMGMIKAMFGGNLPPGFPANDSPSPVELKAADLQEAIDNSTTNADTLKARLASLREARDKARADLARAQNDLKDLVTARQEAALVLMGVLE